MNLTRALGSVGGLTLASRVLGLARDMLFAQFVGANFASDAFAVAVFEDVGLVFSLLDAGGSDLIEIAVALGVVIVGGQIEGRSLHQDCLCPVQCILLRNAVGISHVDSHALPAFAAKLDAQNGFAA